MKGRLLITLPPKECFGNSGLRSASGRNGDFSVREWDVLFLTGACALAMVCEVETEYMTCRPGNYSLVAQRPLLKGGEKYLTWWLHKYTAHL